MKASDAVSDVVMVTGCAGFIGHGVVGALLDRGERVIGIDNLNGYYDTSLKRARLDASAAPGFSFLQQDLADRMGLEQIFRTYQPARIVHLAAQAGVRYSFENPQAYVDANISGFVNLLECARAAGNVEHLLYASSSSVYGANRKQPFAVEDPVDQPVSLYAASKRADDVIS